MAPKALVLERSKSGIIDLTIYSFNRLELESTRTYHLYFGRCSIRLYLLDLGKDDTANPIRDIIIIPYLKVD